MSAEIALHHSLLRGFLWSTTPSWPLAFDVHLCDLRPRFLLKGRIGRGYRAIARNGRVLLASDATLPVLAGRLARVRLQTWHKSILPGDRPQPYGILFCVRALEHPPHRTLSSMSGREGGVTEPGARDVYTTRLGSASHEPFELALEVGGGLRLEFRRRAE
jgi:hypothetical protein